MWKRLSQNLVLGPPSLQMNLIEVNRVKLVASGNPAQGCGLSFTLPTISCLRVFMTNFLKICISFQTHYSALSKHRGGSLVRVSANFFSVFQTFIHTFFPANPHILSRFVCLRTLFTVLTCQTPTVEQAFWCFVFSRFALFYHGRHVDMTQ